MNRIIHFLAVKKRIGSSQVLGITLYLSKMSKFAYDDFYLRCLKPVEISDVNSYYRTQKVVPRPVDR